MLEIQNLLIAKCDEPEEFMDCWGETIIKLEEGEEFEEAIAFLETKGWKITVQNEGMDNECHFSICPYCCNGILETDSDLRRIK